MEYSRFHRKGHIAINLLLALSFFEVPLSCNQSPLWVHLSATERCQVPGKIEGDTLIMNGIPVFPVGLSVSIEVSLLFTVLLTLKSEVELYRALPDGRSSFYGFRYELCAKTLAWLDVILLIFHLCTGEVRSFRIAPYVRLALAVLTIPRIRKLLVTFMYILDALREIAALLLLFIILFAWFSSLIMESMRRTEVTFDKDRFGNPINLSCTIYHIGGHSCDAYEYTSHGFVGTVPIAQDVLCAGSPCLPADDAFCCIPKAHCSLFASRWQSGAGSAYPVVSLYKL